MPWNSNFPLGSVSVKANKAIGQQNTTYIETTMGNSVIGTNTTSTRDHFWNVGANEDGRHRFINSPAFTVGGLATDPVIGTGMDDVLYLKTINGRAEWFHRNVVGVYQITPGFFIDSFTVSSSFSNLGSNALPQNVYGRVVMIQETKKYVQVGSFYTDATKAYGFSNREVIQGTSDDYFVELANGSDSVDLFLRGKRGNFGSGADGTWKILIEYKGL